MNKPLRRRQATDFQRTRGSCRADENNKSPESKPTNPESKGGSDADANDDLKTLPMADLEKKLGSSVRGLSQAEAQKRLAQYGPNQIAEKKSNVFLKFLSYFWGPIPWMIEAAVILSGLVHSAESQFIGPVRLPFHFAGIPVAWLRRQL